MSTTYKFKTTINCSGCVDKVTPVLNKEQNIEHWEVDLDSDIRLLTVKAADMTTDDVQKTLQKAGFKATPV